MKLALGWHENIKFLQRDIVGLAEKHSTKEQRIATETMEGLIKDAATVYKDASWIEANFGGPDTLHLLEEPIGAALDLLRNQPNRSRLIAKLLKDGAGHFAMNSITIEGTEHLSEDTFDEVLAALEAFREAAPKAHQPSPGHGGQPSGKTGVAAACRRLKHHYETIFGKPVTNGWTKIKPIRPSNPATIFIFDVLSLIDPTRTRLEEDLQDLIGNDIAKTPGRRPGRRDR
jgi:hypothetical protein